MPELIFLLSYQIECPERFEARIYRDSMANSVRRIADDNQKSNTWAVKSVAGNVNSGNVDLRRSPRRPAPPQHQSKEDKRIMIRLDSKHEAHNAELFILRKQVQQPVSDPSLFVDAWQVPSGIGVLESSSAKAASILQRKEAIATIFGNVIVE